jgi:hypothetical protein
MPRRIVSLDARRDRVARHRTDQNRARSSPVPPCVALLPAAIAFGRTDKTSPASPEMIDRQEGELFRQNASLPPA